MDTSTVASAPPADARTRPAGPRATLWLLRAVTLLQCLAVLAQPVLAGMFLSGDSDALGAHGINASLVAFLSLSQLVASMLFWLAGRGRGWPVLATALMFLAVVLQIGFGYARQLDLHVPLGVTIVVASVLLTGWTWRPGARRARRAWRRVR